MITVMYIGKNEKIRKSKFGELNPQWKGDNVGNAALHGWVNRNKPRPELCETCNLKPSYDLANITGIYNRNMENWKHLCRKCHMLSDGRMKNLVKLVKRRIMTYDRICLLCDFNKTCIRKTGYEKWYRYEDGYICDKCYNRERRRKKRANM